MKTEFISNKDNNAIAAVMTAILFALVGTLLTSNQAAAQQADLPVAQKMDTIVVTGKQSADVTLDTIVVTASRVQKTQN